jgi:hypothetical protein
VQPLQRDAVPLVPAVMGRFCNARVRAVKDVGDVLAETVVAEEEVVEVRAHVVLLAVAVLTGRRAPVSFLWILLL